MRYGQNLTSYNLDVNGNFGLPVQSIWSDYPDTRCFNNQTIQQPSKPKKTPNQSNPQMYDFVVGDLVTFLSHSHRQHITYMSRNCYYYKLPFHNFHILKTRQFFFLILLVNKVYLETAHFPGICLLSSSRRLVIWLYSLSRPWSRHHQVFIYLYPNPQAYHSCYGGICGRYLKKVFIF